MPPTPNPIQTSEKRNTLSPQADFERPPHKMLVFRPHMSEERIERCWRMREHMPDISLDQIEATARTALERHGAAPWIAAEVANAIRKAEAVGNKICGLYYLESYCVQLQSGRVSGDVEPVVTRPRPGLVQVDAKFGFAQPAFARGLDAAVEAAKECGVASLAIGHAHTCTSLGYFTEQIARAGLIGFGLTNASPIVAPPGCVCLRCATNASARASKMLCFSALSSRSTERTTRFGRLLLCSAFNTL